MPRPRMQPITCGMLMLMIVVSSCGRRLETPRGIVAHGEVYVIASVVPSCGCSSIASRLKSGEIEIVSRLAPAQRKLETLILHPGAEPVRFGFDWAGPGDLDHYEISAFKIEQMLDNKGKPIIGQDGKPVAKHTAVDRIQDYVFVSSPQEDVSCDTKSCDLEILKMNQTLTQQAVSQSVVEVHERGVSYTSGGTVISAAAAIGSCGCVLLHLLNGEKPVVLEAKLFENVRGRLPLSKHNEDVVVAFDWAGNREGDVYTISAFSAPPANSTPTASEPPSATTPGPVPIRDYVSITGHLDHMVCTPEVETPNKQKRFIAKSKMEFDFDGHKHAITCPFGELNMVKAKAEENAVNPVSPPNSTKP